MTQFNTLRPLTQRLISTPVQDLPQISFFLASSISNALKVSAKHGGGRGDESATLLHKLKTKISSLLQDRSAEGRFTATILIKGIVEVGDREILSGCDVWVRGLLALLGRPDPPSIKKLCLMTITRIFILTQQYPTLLREVTTPLLPTFATTGLNLIKPKPSRTNGESTAISSPLLETVLRCFIELLPRHPTIFRPFLPRLRPISISLIADNSIPDTTGEIARELFVALHFCSPKDTATIEWAKACSNTITSIHDSSDQVFRAVVEDWESSDSARRQKSVRKDYSDVVHGSEQDSLGLPGWTGLHNGVQRVASLLRLLGNFLSDKTMQQVSLPIGQVLDLTSRLLSVTVPSGGKESPFSLRPNPEISRDEREELWVNMPTMHLATLDLLYSLILRFSQALLPVIKIILDQNLWIFDNEKWSEEIRMASYRVLGEVLPLLGSSMNKRTIISLSGMITSCCADQLSRTSQDVQTMSSSLPSSRVQPNAPTSNNADSFLSSLGKLSEDLQSLETTATSDLDSTLLATFLTHIPAPAIPRSLRSEMDRTAILTQNKEAMLASVLNPPPALKGGAAPPSILTFLVRSSGRDDNDLECLLRPRMPVIHGSASSVNPPDGDLDQEEEDDDMTPESPKGTDLLDHLEHSLDKSPVETAKKNASHTSTTILEDGLAQIITAETTGMMNMAQELQHGPSIKRNFADISMDRVAATAASETPPLRVHILEPEPNKRARLDFPVDQTDHLHVSRSQDPGENDTAFFAESHANAPLTVQQSVSGRNEPTPSSKTDDEAIRKELGADDESDKSDFEMPEINVEADTDDEEDSDDSNDEG